MAKSKAKEKEKPAGGIDRLAALEEAVRQLQADVDRIMGRPRKD